MSILSRFHQVGWLALIATLCLPLSLTICAAADNYALVIHGGAGGDPTQWSEETKQRRRHGLARALEHGIERLQAGAHAIDVVESVVRILEDDPTFNAAKGCVLNEQGEHELDASIMDGKTLKCGAVAGVTRPRNPVSLARLVMQHTDHILLMGNGAEEFAVKMGVPFEEPEYFRTEARIEGWQQWKLQEQKATGAHSGKRTSEAYFGTVGCVVVDQHGDLAAATSTGGLMGKKWGRVGDSPIIGAGNYANNDSCAVSGTGVGEEFIRFNVAADVAARMRYGNLSLQEAAQQTIAQLPENCGGIIAVDQAGKLVMEFNTIGMSRAFANAAGERGILLSRDE